VERDTVSSERNMMSEQGESEIRKRIWIRKDAVDAKMSEPGFAALPDEERDAWVLCLQLDIPFETAQACANGSADEAVLGEVQGKIAEAFKYGKRKALRELRDVLSRHGNLQTERADSE